MAQAFYPLPNYRAGNPNGGSLHELAAPKMHSRHVTVPLVGSYPTFSPFQSLRQTKSSEVSLPYDLLPHRDCCYFLLHCSTLTDCFYIRKWDALCCPDFPLATHHLVAQRQTVRLLSHHKVNDFFADELTIFIFSSKKRMSKPICIFSQSSLGMQLFFSSFHSSIVIHDIPPFSSPKMPPQSPRQRSAPHHIYRSAPHRCMRCGADHYCGERRTFCLDAYVLKKRQRKNHILNKGSLNASDG